MPGTLFVVATPIGNLEDITARALRVLREVTLIAAEDTRRTAHLLARYAITTRTTSLHEHNEASKSASLVERLKRGDSIALVSDAGTPTVSDPGARLIGAAIDSGARVEPIPGPNAALAALVASGLPSETYLFLGFPPIRSKDRKLWFEALRTAGRTVVFFEAPHRIRRTLEELREEVGDCRVAIGRELTKAHEEFVRGPISVALTNLKTLKGEFTVVVDIGHITENGALKRAQPEVDESVLAAEFGQLIDNGAVDRRTAIAVLTRKYSRTRNDIYEAIERAKKSGV
jgi:16S rRNA (cytidine1402-2'-O)-methyltransferase